MAKAAYKRILLKLSGEALEGPGRTGIDSDTLEGIAHQVAEARGMGVEIGLVVGGGNIFRGAQGCATGIDRPTGDYMGMLATAINALAIQAALENAGAPACVLSAIEMRPVAEPCVRGSAIRHIEKGRVVVFACGTGNPFFTTDTAAALRASEINAEILLKATKVDGVYDSDPVVNKGAKRFDRLTYAEVLARDLRVMDATAISLCRESKLPILVFNLTRPGSIIKALQGETIGTIVAG